MDTTERDQALERLRGFATQQREAEYEADRNSLDRAADIVSLYDDIDENGRRRWALEMEPPKTRRHMGRPVDPESFSRFTRWLMHEKSIPLAGAHLYRLRDAHQIRTTYLSQGEISPLGEREIRPLKWLIKNEHPEAIAEVWYQAAQLAGGSTPDSTAVKKALATWKSEHVPKQKRTISSAPTGPEALRLEMERLARQLMDQAPEQFVLGFDHIEAMASKRFAKPEANVA